MANSIYRGVGGSIAGSSTQNFVNVVISGNLTVLGTFTFPSTALPAILQAIVALSGTGFIARTGTDTVATRSILGTANQIAVANGTGAAGDATISLPAVITAPGTIAATGSITAGTGLTVTTGGLTVTAGGSTITAGGETITAGNLSMGSGAIVPNQTVGITGTTTNNNAQAGAVGEQQSTTGTGVSLAASTATTVSSFSLGAGDWEVTGSIVFQTGTTSSITAAVLGLSTTAATLPNIIDRTSIQGISVPSSQSIVQHTPTTRFSLSTTTTIYLVGYREGTGTTTADSRIRARRVR